MSADNGIYILPVKVFAAPTILAYYVHHMQAVDNLTHAPDRKDGYNNNRVLDFIVFGTRFTERDKALVHAHDLLKELQVCEYGVSELPVLDLRYDWP